MGFGKTVRRFRKAAHMTQSELARQASVFAKETITQGYIANLETRDYDNSKYIVAFARALDVSAETLLDSAQQDQAIAERLSRSDAAEQNMQHNAAQHKQHKQTDPLSMLVQSARLHNNGDDTPEETLTGSQVQVNGVDGAPVISVPDTLLGTSDSNRLQSALAPNSLPKIKMEQGQVIVIDIGHKHIPDEGYYYLCADDTPLVQRIAFGHGSKLLIGEDLAEVPRKGLEPHVIGKVVLHVISYVNR